MAGIRVILSYTLILMLMGVDSRVYRPEFDNGLFRLPRPNPCSYKNGGCMHICYDHEFGSHHCGCDDGFKLHHNGRDCIEANCHLKMTLPHGEITTYSDPHPRICDWQIITTPGDRIKLIFQDILVKATDQCAYETITVYDGDSDKSPVLGKFCNMSLPRPLIASGNQMYLVFISRLYYPRSNGFKAKYRTVSYYHETNSSRGDISSPNYPDDYPSEIIYGSLFTTTPGHRIKLDFQDFNLEFDERCAYDNVTVYDGVSEDYPVLGTFCGGNVPHPLISTGKDMYLEFKSDPSLQRTGFNATHTTVCGGHFRDDVNNGIFYSHVKFDNENFKSEADCEWILEGLNGEKILLQFLTFNFGTTYGKDCSYNEYVEVYDGKDDSAKSFGKYCGSKDSFIILSSGNFLMVRFRSKSLSSNYYGFSAKWKAFDPSQPFSNPFCA